MKLIRCHIENFGVLSDFDFSFAEGLTTIAKVTDSAKVPLPPLLKRCSMAFPARVPVIS